MNEDEEAVEEPITFEDIQDIDVEDSGPILTKRPRGVLSHTDREYLCGLRDYEHVQSEANRKQQIRERVANGFTDFRLLTLLQSEEERRKTLREELEEEQLYRSIEAMIEYVFSSGVLQDEDCFERLIENGVYGGANTTSEGRPSGSALDVDVSIDIKYSPDVDKLYQRLQSGGAGRLTPAEIGILVREGKLDAEDLEKIEEANENGPNET